MALHFACVGTDGTRLVVWGLGHTEEAARLDAKEWLEQAGDLESDARDCEVERITAEQFEVAKAGDVSWPIEA